MEFKIYVQISQMKHYPAVWENPKNPIWRFLLQFWYCNDIRTHAWYGKEKMWKADLEVPGHWWFFWVSLLPVSLKLLIKQDLYFIRVWFDNPVLYIGLLNSGFLVVYYNNNFTQTVENKLRIFYMFGFLYLKKSLYLQ